MASLKNNVSESSKKAVESVASEASGGFDFEEITHTVLVKFLQVAEAVLILVVTYFFILWVRRYFEKMEIAHEQQRTALNLVEKIVSGFVFVVGLTLALKTVGLDISLLVSVGLLGLSYGLKDAIKNYIAGILIFFKSPFKIGDIVKIKHFVGKVEKMEFQATSLKTFDNRDVTIYNSDIMAQSIENYSRYPMRRMEINVSLGYGSDVQKAMKIFDSILANNQMVLKNPKYSIVFHKFSFNGIMVKLKIWVNYPCNMLKIRTNIAMEINKAFDEENLISPYSRSFETDSDFGFTEKRKMRIQQFYTQPIIAAVLAAETVAAAGVVQQEAEVIDGDEPID